MLLVFLWDSKVITDQIGKNKSDCLPLLVSGNRISQLLSVTKFSSNTGEAKAAAIFGAIENWDKSSNICVICFDTSNSNTGRNATACILLEQKLENMLLSLVCRHHVMELSIGSVFEVCMEATSSPEVPLFKYFKER